MFACNTRCKLVETPCVLCGLVTLYCSHKYTPGVKALFGAIQKASFVFLLFDNARGAHSLTNDILYKVYSVIVLQASHFQSKLKSLMVGDILRTKSLRYNASYYCKWTKCRQRSNVFNCTNIHKSGADKCSCAQAFSTNTKASFQYEYKLSNTYL